MAQQYVSPTDVTSDDKLWALLSYLIPIIVPIVVLLMEDKKNRPFIRSHAIQALIFEVIYSVLFCLSPIGYIIGIYFAVKAYQGEMVVIPVITDFVKKQNWA